MSKPHWQNWDDPGVAEWIEAYWQGNLHEAAQRQVIANLCRHGLQPAASVLEVGCGTGLVYERLVPLLVENGLYTGVDISQRMLDIARAKFPHGRFLLGSGYGLDFADQAFDHALAFEVVIHIPELAPFIRELYRVARRSAIFSAWVTAASDLEDGRVSVLGSGEFYNRRYSHAYLLDAIAAALPGVDVDVEVAILRVDCWAYVLTPRSLGEARGPGEASGPHREARGVRFVGLRPVPGYTEALLAALRPSPRADLPGAVS